MTSLLASSAVLSFSVFTATSQQTRWGPEQWVPIFTSIILSAGAVLAGWVGAKHGREAKDAARETNQAIRLPSNGITLGALAEGLAHVQHQQANILALLLNHPETASAVDIARKLTEKKKDP